MSEPTLSSMHDARDAEDKRLLEAKEHTQLLENYVYLVQEWAAVRASRCVDWTPAAMSIMT